MTDVIGFSNRGRDKLSGAHSIGTTTLTLTTGGLMPPAGTAFDVSVDLEYIHVPAGVNTGGPVYTGVLRAQYGSTAVSHVDATPVVEVVTAAEMNALVQTLQNVHQGSGTFDAEVQSISFKATGVAGATANPLIVAGMTTSGAPASGTHREGEIVAGLDGTMWLCTVAGTPGTWVEISGAGGSSTLAADTDVLLTTPANNDVLTYETASSKWKNKPAAADTDTLAADTDVLLTTPANNDVLTYETASSKWKNKPASSGALSGLTDVLIATPLNADVLTYNSTASKWENQPSAAGGGSSVNKVQLTYNQSSDINGVSLTINTWTDVFANQSFTVDDSASVIEILTIGELQMFGNAAQGAVRLVVDSGGTPVIVKIGGTETNTTPGGGNLLSGAGTAILTGLAAGSHTVKLQCFANATGNAIYCRASSTPDTEFMTLKVIERKVVGGTLALASDSDVLISGATNGQVLTFNTGSGKWVNANSTSASLAGDSDVTITTPANGDVLTYVSAASKWENQPAAGGGGGSMTALLTVTPSGVTTVTFSGWAGTHKHLKIIGTVKSNSLTVMGMRFNGDSGANYAWTDDHGRAGLSGFNDAHGDVNLIVARSNGNANCYYALDIEIPLYRDTTYGGSAQFRHTAIDTNSNSPDVGWGGGRWFGAAAITSITLFGDTGTLTGELELYGYD